MIDDAFILAGIILIVAGALYVGGIGWAMIALGAILVALRMEIWGGEE